MEIDKLHNPSIIAKVPVKTEEVRNVDATQIQTTIDQRLAHLPVLLDGTVPIVIPEQYRAFYSVLLPESTTLANIAWVYGRVFSELPWEEQGWTEKQVLSKLKCELGEGQNWFLILMTGDEQCPIAGFSWGTVLEKTSLLPRIQKALGTTPEFILQTLNQKTTPRILYFDEFAIDARFRRGINPVRFLLRGGLEFAYQRETFETLFWSTPESHTASLALSMGYEILGEIRVRGKKILFLYLRDFRTLLKITQHLTEGEIIGLIKQYLPTP